MHLRSAVVIWVRFPAAWAAETVGSNRTETEPVSTLGKRISGRLIPVRIP